MNSQEQEMKMQLRQEYRNVWHSDLMDTGAVDPLYCIFSVLCAPCSSYVLRRRALYGDMTRYVCCAGYMPCSGHCGEHNSPECCLATEVMCCFGNSVASTRWMIQDEFDIQTTPCDNCLIGFMICINQVACIFDIVACLLGSDELKQLAEVLKCLANLVYCSVCACMQTQHKIELDKRDGMFGSSGVMAVPPVQAMSRIDQPYPPTVGYPPQQQYPPSGGYGPPPYPQQPYPPYGGGYPDQPYPPTMYPPAPYHTYPPDGYPSPNQPSQTQMYPPAPYPPPAYPPSEYPPTVPHNDSESDNCESGNPKK